MNQFKKEVVWTMIGLTLAILVGVFWLVHRENQKYLRKLDAEIALSQTLDRSSTAAIMYGIEDGSIFFVTSGFCRIAGYEAGELIGKKIDVVFGGLEGEKATELSELIVTPRRPDVGWGDVKTKKGFHVQVRRMIITGKLRKICVLNTPDGSTSIDLLLALLEEANIGVWWWEQETDNLIWDKRMFLLFGFPEDDWTSDYKGFEDRVVPEDRERIRQAVDEAIFKGTPFQEVFRIVTDKGKLQFIRAYGMAFEDGGQRVFAGLNIQVSKAEFDATTTEPPK